MISNLEYKKTAVSRTNSGFTLFQITPQRIEISLVLQGAWQGQLHELTLQP
jgi:hypothetical protein